MRCLLLSLVVLASAGCVAARQQSLAAQNAEARWERQHHGWQGITIWELAALADDIVVADAGATREESRLLEPNWLRTRLTVRENWKGDLPRDTSVGRANVHLCGIVYKPGQPQEGRRAIVFSVREAGGDRLLGVRHPSSAEDLAQYRHVIGDALARQAAGEDIDKAWMLLAARTRATRWDGLTALETLEESLSPAELQSVADAIVAEPAVDAALELSMRYLQVGDRRKNEDAFATSVEALISGERSWHPVIRYIEAVVSAKGCQVDRNMLGQAGPDEAVACRSSAGSEVCEPTANAAGVRAWWGRVKSECGLRPQPVAGVGTWRELELGMRPE